MNTKNLEQDEKNKNVLQGRGDNYVDDENRNCRGYYERG